MDHMILQSPITLALPLEEVLQGKPKLWSQVVKTLKAKNPREIDQKGRCTKQLTNASQQDLRSLRNYTKFKGDKGNATVKLIVKMSSQWKSLK